MPEAQDRLSNLEPNGGAGRPLPPATVLARWLAPLAAPHRGPLTLGLLQ